MARPAGPAASEVRAVLCPHCDSPFEIAARAMSVNCPRCSQRVVAENLRIDAYLGVMRLATVGRVDVTKRGHVSAKVRVNEMVVAGTVKGEVTAVERMEIQASARVFADLRTPRLQVEPGAVLVGRLDVGEGALPARRGSGD
jgi:cytoskeletal protein CcmA (bactofilin family)